MADARYRSLTGPNYLRVESGQLLTAETVASKIENMYPTEEGTLRSIWGPCPFIVDVATQEPVDFSGAPVYGVHQAKVGDKEIILVHAGSKLYSYTGWTRSFTEIGDMSPIVPGIVRAATQFVSVPNGIIILTQESSPLFYDGILLASLGYDRAPGPPQGEGPTSSGIHDAYSKDVADWNVGVNDLGYAYDGAYFTSTGMHPSFGMGRLGTVERHPGVNAEDLTDEASPQGTFASRSQIASTSGQLLDGLYRAAVQWIDRWGNLSPISGRSNAVTFRQQRAIFNNLTDGQKYDAGSVDMPRKQVLWTNIGTGPATTIGRILLRTKDEKHSGTTKLFEVPPNAQEGNYAYATICDNLCKIYPDNTPDSWLLKEALDVVPVEPFSIGAVAFGRFWAAGFRSDSGRIHPSQPGFWGTFARGDALYPDTAGEVTALLRTQVGLLAFSETNTFLIVPADDGSGRFVLRTLSASIGCLSQGSCQVLPNGEAIWLSHSGFYTYNGKDLENISKPIESTLKRLNRARARQICSALDRKTREYICWIPVDGSVSNTLALVFTGEGWRRRSDIVARGACSVKDHRNYTLVAGRSSNSADDTYDTVWILDTEIQGFDPAIKTFTVETAWMGAARSMPRKSPLDIYLWLRETYDGNLTVEVMRDWRESPVVETQTDFVLNATDDPPPFWGSAVYGAELTPAETSNTYRKKRPYWRRTHIAVPSCEVYKIRITSTVPLEFLGIMVGENLKDAGGSRTPP